VPLGEGQVNIRKFVQTLMKIGYPGPLCIEREAGDQASRMRDIVHGIRYLRECLAAK
jgi:sugar phosphate isomerase/epimerase